MATIEETIACARSNGRVCPQPQKWNQLYELLPGRSRNSTGWEPSLPLVLAAWWDTSDSDKAERLQKHIEWAANRGALPEVFRFLSSLSERDWHHAGE
jgi:hypothetical protein